MQISANGSPMGQVAFGSDRSKYGPFAIQSLTNQAFFVKIHNNKTIKIKKLQSQYWWAPEPLTIQSLYEEKI